MPDTIKVVVVDDHPLMLFGVCSMLEGHQDITVAGMAHDGEEAFALAEKVKPDVMLLDIMMPGMDGVTLARKMRSELPDVALLMLSSDTSTPTIEQLLEIGVDGFLPKTCDAVTLVNAVRSAAAG